MGPAEPRGSPSKEAPAFPDRAPLLPTHSDNRPAAAPHASGGGSPAPWPTSLLRSARSTHGSDEQLLGGGFGSTERLHASDSDNELLELPFDGSRVASKLASYTSEPAQTMQLMRQWAEAEAALLQQEQQQQQQVQQVQHGQGSSTVGPGLPASLPRRALNALPPLAIPSQPRPVRPGASHGTGTATPPATSTTRLTPPDSPRKQEQQPAGAGPGEFGPFRTFSMLPTDPQTSPRARPLQASQHQQQQQPRQRGVRRRLGVQLLADPLAEQRGVHNHRVAGDLFLATGGKDGTWGSEGGFRILPLPPEMASAVLQLDLSRKPRSPSKAKRKPSPPTRRDDNEREDADEMDLEFNEDEQSRPLWDRPGFWKAAISVLATLAFLLAGVLMAMLQTDERLESWFQWWRLLIFISTLIPIWWIGTFFGRAILWVTEKRFFTAENFLFFVYTVRKPLANVLRSGLLLASWAACMYESAFSDRETNSSIQPFYDAYTIILELCACLLLFFVAELLKVLFAKMISSKFNRESHVRKMQAALRKERYLDDLLQARPRPWQEAESDLDKAAGGDTNGGEGDSKPSTGVGGASPKQLTGPPNLARRSAPTPSLLHAKRSLRSFLSLGHFRERSGSLPTGTGLDTIVEEHEESGHEDGPVVLDIDSPSQASSTPRTQPRSGASTPIRSLSASVHLGAAGGQVQRSTLSGSSLPASRSPSKLPPSPQQATAGAKAGPPVQPGGLLKQGGKALGDLFKQGRKPAESLPTGRQGSLTGGGGIARRSSKSGTSEGLARSSSVAVGDKAGKGAKQSSTAAAKEKAQRSLDMESTVSLMKKGPVAIAAKMARVEKHIRKRNLQVTFYDELGQMERREKVTNQNEAKRLAFYLFYNVKTDFDRPYITVEDLEGFLPEKQAQEAYAMLDTDGNGRVTLAECAHAVMNVFQEREYLAASLRDTKNIVNKLGFMIGIGLHIVFFFFYLLILGLDAWKVFIAIVPVLGALSFALGSSVKQAVDNSIFLFVTHPFDVGDIIVFNDSWHKVEEITLPCTVLLRTADSAKIWYPNSQLINIPLHNLTMSPPLAEITTFIVDAATPVSVVDDVKNAVAKYCSERTLDFNGKVSTWFAMASDPLRPNRLALKVKVEYNYGMLNPRCLPARGALFHFILNKLAELKVEVTNVVQPVALRGSEDGAPHGLPANWVGHAPGLV